MKAIEVMNIMSKMRKLYREKCAPVCKEYGINQSGLDILLFLGHNPDHNTARDICEIRGIKTGIVSVVVEQLIQKGYLERKEDEKDRRIQRLFLTEASYNIVRAGENLQQETHGLLCEKTKRPSTEYFIKWHITWRKMKGGNRTCGWHLHSAQRFLQV